MGRERLGMMVKSREPGVKRTGRPAIESGEAGGRLQYLRKGTHLFEECPLEELYRVIINRREEMPSG